MDFNLKTYKCSRIKHYFKTSNSFFLFQGTSLYNENWIKIEQILVGYELKSYRILNKLMITTLKNSMLKNVLVLTHGPIILLTNNYNNTKVTFKELDNINPLINLLGFGLNNKIYFKRQIKNLKKMSYLENVSLLHKSMRTVIKIPYYKFKIKKPLAISK